MKNATEMKSAMEIYREVAQGYQELSNMERNVVAEGLAGKFHITRMTEMLSNWDNVEKQLTDSINSKGSALKENETYMQSIEARVSKLKAKWEELSLAMGKAFLEDGFIHLVDTLSSLAKVGSSVASTVGVLPVLFGTVSTALLLMSSRFRTVAKDGTILNAVFGGLTVGAGALKTAFRSLAASTGIGLLFVGIGFAAEKIISYFGKVKEESEKLAAKNRILTNEYKDNKDQITELVAKYEEYSNKLKSTNDNLGTEELKEYSNIKNELANLMPSLVIGEDQYGNKILVSSDAIKEKTKLLERQLEIQKEIDERARRKEVEENYETALKDIEDAKKEIDNLFAGSQNPLLKNIEDYERKFKELNEKRINLAKDGRELSPIDQRNLEYYDTIIKKYNDLNDKISESRLIFQNSAMDMIKSTLLLEEGTSEAVTSMINDITTFVASTGDSEESVSGVFEKIIGDLKDNKGFVNILKDYDTALEKHRKATEENLPEKEVEEYAEKVKDSFGEIKDYVLDLAEAKGFDPNQIKELNILLDGTAQSALGLNDASKETGESVLRANAALSEMGVSAESADGAMKKLNVTQERFVELVKSGKVVIDGEGKVIEDLRTEYEKLNDEINKLIRNRKSDEAFAKLSSDAYSETADSVSVYNGLLEKLAEGKQISAAEAMDLIKQEKDLAKAIKVENGQVEVNIKVVERLKNAKIKSYKAMIEMAKQSSIATANQVISNIKNYNLEIKAIKSVADAKAAIDEINLKSAELALQMNKSKMPYSIWLEEFNELARQKALFQELLNSIDGFDDLSDSVEASLNQVGTSAEKSSDSTKEMVYITDEFKNAIDELNTKLKEQQAIKNKFPKHSKEYRDALKKEIELLKKKGTLIDKERKSLQSQITSGNIQPKGMTTVGDIYGVNSGTIGNANDNLYKILTKQIPLSVEQINQWISSKAPANSLMRGMGEAFVEAAKQSGLDPLYLVAHAAHETAWGDPTKSSIFQKKGNPYGIGAFDSNPYGNAYSFDGKVAGIIEGAKWIARNYVNKGQNTLYSMRHNGGVHQYATDPLWDDKIANIMSGAANVLGNTITNSFSNATSNASNVVAQTARYYLDNYTKDIVSGGHFRDRGGAHKGTDFNQAGNADLGDPIKSFQSGKVSQAYYSKSGGWMVVVQQDDGTIARYLHMNKKPLVSAGQRVSAGQTLGEIGDSGDSHGAHLHSDIQRNGQYIDPIKYLQSLAGGVASVAAETAAKTYTVKSGDTLSEIGQKFGVSWRKLAEINNLSNPNKLSIGQVLKISEGSGGSNNTNAGNNTSSGNSEAEKQQAIDQAKGEVNQLKQESTAIAEELQQLYFALTESQIAYYERLKEYRDDDIKKAEYYAGLYEENTKEFRKYTQQRLDSVKQQRAFHASEMKYIADQIKGNKNISEAHREQLKVLYNQKKMELYEFAEAINEIERALADSKINELVEKINKRMEKINQKIEGFDHEISLTDSEDLDKLINLNEGKLNDIVNQRGAIVTNIEELLKLRKELKDDPESYEKITEEIENWKEQLDDLELSIHDVRQEIKDMYNDIADELVDTMKEAYKRKRDIELDAIDKERKSLEDLHEDKMKMLDEEMKKYNDIVSAKLKSIDRQEDKDNYEKELNKKQKDLQELQSKRNVLALDDSVEGRKRLSDIEKQIEDKEDEIVQFKHNRQVELRKQSLQDELEAKQKEVEAERKKSQEEFENNRESLEKKREDTERYYENIIENERYWAEVREDILEGSINKYNELLKGHQSYLNNHIEFIGESVTNNFADRINKVQDLLKAVGDGIKDVFKDVDKAISGQDKKNENNQKNNNISKPKQNSSNPLGSLPEDPKYQPPSSGGGSSGGNSNSGSGGSSGSKPTPKGTVEATANVWLHSSPDTSTKSRIRILSKGSRWRYYGEKNGMYNLGGSQYASKKYMKVVSGSGSSNSSSGNNSSSKTNYKTTSSLNLRSSPSYGNNVVTVMPKGAKVEYLGMEKGWAKIKYNGKTGYAGKSYLQQFDTGGFTGSFGKDGRLAVLHEKELVLNKVDTKNILKTVELVRNMTTNLPKLTIPNITPKNSNNETHIHMPVTIENLNGTKDGGREFLKTINNGLKGLGVTFK